MQEAIKTIQNELSGIYSIDEVKTFSYMILEHITGFDKIKLLTGDKIMLTNEQQHKIKSFIVKLKLFTPIQYILGQSEFYGLPFCVNESVLIPRPETEELIEWIQQAHKAEQALNILDIGTGSGCIAITLQHQFKHATTDAFDVSTEALKTATLNAKKNNTAVHFQLVDILAGPHFNKKWDLIVSNPPYIALSEKEAMSANVLEHEPHLALFVPDNDPLLFYRHIGLFALEHLSEKGYLYFEINSALGPETASLLQQQGFSQVVLRSDISANHRMIQARK